MKSGWKQLVPHSTEGLAKRTRRAVQWHYAGNATRMAINFGVSVLLTRLLGPAPYGQVASAMVVCSFANLLANAGLPSALIQKQELSAEDIRFCNTVQLCIATCLTALLTLSAPFWEQFFHAPGTAHVFRALSLVFMFQAAGTTSTALLNRSLRTQVIQACSVASYAVAYLLVGVPMAFAGFGVWSLVAAQLVQVLLNSILVYLNVRHPLLPMIDRKHMEMFGFGNRVMFANISSWSISNLDNTVVGRVAGPVMLGLYSRAFTLASVPAESATSGMLQILLPALSRVQRDKEKIARYYAALFGVVCMVLCPIFLAAAVVPDVVVLGLFGEKWTGAVQLFRPLAIAIPLNGLLAIAGPVLTARGKPGIELRGQATTAVLAGAVYWMAVHRSVLALSWSVLAVYVVRTLVLSGLALREVGGKWTDLLSTAAPGLILSVFTMVVVGVSRMLLPSMSYVMQLLMVIAIGATSLLSFCFLTSGWLFRPIIAKAPQLENVLPWPFRRSVPCEQVS